MLPLKTKEVIGYRRLWLPKPLHQQSSVHAFREKIQYQFVLRPWCVSRKNRVSSLDMTFCHSAFQYCQNKHLSWTAWEKPKGVKMAYWQIYLLVKPLVSDIYFDILIDQSSFSRPFAFFIPYPTNKNYRITNILVSNNSNLVKITKIIILPMSSDSRPFVMLSSK